MYTLLFIVLVLSCLVLITAILLQAGKGSGLAASFGGSASAAESVIGTRQAGNLLTRVSWWAGGLFLGLSLLLSLMGTRARAPRSVLEGAFTPAPAAPAPGRGAAPAVPLSPTTPAPTAPAPAAPTTPATPSGAAPAPR